MTATATSTAMAIITPLMTPIYDRIVKDEHDNQKVDVNVNVRYQKL
jgi:hypothetical protein